MLKDTINQIKNKYQLADWIEFYATKRSMKLSEFQKILESGEDTESRSNFDAEEKLREIQDVLGERQEKLGDSYPFILSEGVENITIKSDLSFSQTVYLLCLFSSYLKSNDVINYASTEHLKANTINIRNKYFQFISCLSAGAMVGGKAFWFGSPRPCRTGFQAGLTNLFNAIKQGRVKDKDLWHSAASDNPGDADIDVFSWREQPTSGKTHNVCIVQVTTSYNIDKKFLTTEDMKQFRSGYVDGDVFPAKENFLRAIFVPYELDNIVGLEDYRSNTVLDRKGIPAFISDLDCKQNNIVNVTERQFKHYQKKICILVQRIIGEVVVPSLI